MYHSEKKSYMCKPANLRNRSTCTRLEQVIQYEPMFIQGSKKSAVWLFHQCCMIILKFNASSHCQPRIAVANCEQWYIIFSHHISHLPWGKGSGNSSTNLKLAQSKRYLSDTCPKGNFEFKVFSCFQFNSVYSHFCKIFT